MSTTPPQTERDIPKWTCDALDEEFVVLRVGDERFRITMEYAVEETLHCQHCGVEVVGIPAAHRGGPCPSCGKENHDAWELRAKLRRPSPRATRERFLHALAQLGVDVTKESR